MNTPAGEIARPKPSSKYANIKSKISSRRNVMRERIVNTTKKSIEQPLRKKTPLKVEEQPTRSRKVIRQQKIISNNLSTERDNPFKAVPNDRSRSKKISVNEHPLRRPTPPKRTNVISENHETENRNSPPPSEPVDVIIDAKIVEEPSVEESSLLITPKIFKSGKTTTKKPIISPKKQIKPQSLSYCGRIKYPNQLAGGFRPGRLIPMSEYAPTVTIPVNNQDDDDSMRLSEESENDVIVSPMTVVSSCFIKTPQALMVPNSPASFTNHQSVRRLDDVTPQLEEVEVEITSDIKRLKQDSDCQSLTEEEQTPEVEIMPPPPPLPIENPVGNKSNKSLRDVSYSLPDFDLGDVSSIDSCERKEFERERVLDIAKGMAKEGGINVIATRNSQTPDKDKRKQDLKPSDDTKRLKSEEEVRVQSPKKKTPTKKPSPKAKKTIATKEESSEESEEEGTSSESEEILVCRFLVNFDELK